MPHLFRGRADNAQVRRRFQLQFPKTKRTGPGKPEPMRLEQGLTALPFSLSASGLPVF
jgi:hypothetical protein